MSFWLKCVACVIIYNSERQIFLGKRPKESVEGGKWALSSGKGSFEESTDRLDFARRELQYDLSNRVVPSRLKYFDTFHVGDIKRLCVEDIYSYKADELIRFSNRKKALANGRWFSISEIKKLEERGQIAFDHFEIMIRFIK